MAHGLKWDLPFSQNVSCCTPLPPASSRTSFPKRCDGREARHATAERASVMSKKKLGAPEDIFDVPGNKAMWGSTARWD